MRCCIPEYKFNLQHLIELLITDKQYNPSNYALIILSEGAEWEGYQVKEVGEADAFGHKKKTNVGEDLADEIKKSTGEETIVSDLTYDLRSGSPDFVDKMVASTFASMAMDCIQQGQHGVMMAISAGCYAAVPIPDPKSGPRARGFGDNVQHPAVPPELREQVGTADLPDARVDLWGRHPACGGLVGRLLAETRSLTVAAR